MEKLCADIIVLYIIIRKLNKKIKYNSRYHDRPYYRMVQNNAI